MHGSVLFPRCSFDAGQGDRRGSLLSLIAMASNMSDAPVDEKLPLEES